MIHQEVMKPHMGPDSDVSWILNPPREDSRQHSSNISYWRRSKQKAACGQSSLVAYATPFLPTACGHLPLTAEMKKWRVEQKLHNPKMKYLLSISLSKNPHTLL